MIYFIQPVGGGPIKIGFSDDVPRRIKQLELHYRQPLVLLAVFPGGQSKEFNIHERFSQYRIGRTEQFYPAREILEFIGRPLLVMANPNAVEAIPYYATIQFDRILHGKAQLVAKDLGIPVAEVISEAARASIEKAYAKLVRKIGNDDEGTKP